MALQGQLFFFQPFYFKMRKYILHNVPGRKKTIAASLPVFLAALFFSYIIFLIIQKYLIKYMIRMPHIVFIISLIPKGDPGGLMS